MKRRFLTSFALCLAVLVVLAAGPVAAKDKAAKNPKMSQVNGTVHMINKDTSTITVRKGTVERKVVYNADTKWAKGTQDSSTPSSVDEVKENYYINCKGTSDGAKLVASACRFRESK